MSNKALFLDRDGVINLDHGYVYRIQDFEFQSGIFELVHEACQRDYLVIVVTNQSGIARGMYTEQEFHALSDWMVAQFEQNGGSIHRVYHSPFHPVSGLGEFKKDTDCRKPGPGMLFSARDELDIDLGQSVMIGDKVSDMQAAINAGVPRRFLLNSSKNGDWVNASNLTQIKEALIRFD